MEAAMKRFILAACVVTAAAAWVATALEGQDLIIDSVTGEPVARTLDLESLRERYVNLVRRRAESMSVEELREATRKLRHDEQDDPEAYKALWEAAAACHKVMNEHTESRSAEIARMMLDVYESETEVFDQPISTPRRQ
jgi:hypothetical protein